MEPLTPSVSDHIYNKHNYIALWHNRWGRTLSTSMDITQLDVFWRKTGNPGYRRAHYMNPGAHVMDKISHPSLTHGLIYLTIIKEMYSSMHGVIAKEHYDC